jgi:glycosyltransferase involved in cell wall biosynthesis
VTHLDVVVPEGIHDPARPSGGNTYDRVVCRELRDLGWVIREHPVPGRWPSPDSSALAALNDVIRRMPDGAVVLVDGLIASAAPEVLVSEAPRVRLVVLVHMPLGDSAVGAAAESVRTRERAVLSAAVAVVTTSEWSRNHLVDLYQLPAERLHVAEPGVGAADAAIGSEAGGAMLCVGSVIPDKGHGVLLDALQMLSDLTWQCVCVGRLDRDPAFVQRLRRRSRDAGLDDRVHFRGPQAYADLERSYGGADLMVLASRAETYGMVITEALAHGVPVVVTEVGGVTEALGQGSGDGRPGLLVPPDDPPALAAALRAWLTDAELRRRLRRAARTRRESLHSWADTAATVADVVAGAAR